MCRWCKPVTASLTRFKEPGIILLLSWIAWPAVFTCTICYELWDQPSKNLCRAVHTWRDVPMYWRGRTWAVSGGPGLAVKAMGLASFSGVEEGKEKEHLGVNFISCCCMPSGSWIPTQNITHSPCTSKCTIYTPTTTNPLPSTTLLCTQLILSPFAKWSKVDFWDNMHFCQWSKSYFLQRC